MTRMMQELKIPDVSVDIIREGTVVHARGYGYANVEHQVLVKLETLFQSGSVGKQFTAMAVMILIDQGKLHLDDSIRVYFTDSPIEWSTITVRHLLTHASGMSDYPESINFRADYSEEQIYEEIKKISLLFQPGDQWKYSNLGYVMLGILIHRMSGQFYDDFLRGNVFGPLNMTTARVIGDADIIPNRASGYVLTDGAFSLPSRPVLLRCVLRKSFWFIFTRRHRFSLFSQLVSSRFKSSRVHWPWTDHNFWRCICQVHWVPP